MLMAKEVRMLAVKENYATTDRAYVNKQVKDAIRELKRRKLKVKK